MRVMLKRDASRAMDGDWRAGMNGTIAGILAGLFFGALLVGLGAIWLK